KLAAEFAGADNADAGGRQGSALEAITRQVAGHQQGPLFLVEGTDAATQVGIERLAAPLLQLFAAGAVLDVAAVEILPARLVVADLALDAGDLLVSLNAGLDLLSPLIQLIELAVLGLGQVALLILGG